MQIYVTDSDYNVLKKLETVINSNPKRKAMCFTNLRSLAEAVKREPPDAVLIDFDMPNSRMAIRTIRCENPDTQIVMMTENKNSLSALFEFDLNGYLLKPISDEKIEEQLFRLKHPILAKFMSSGADGGKND